MQNGYRRLKTQRDAKEPKQQISFEKYGQHLKNQLDQLYKLIAHRKKPNKEEIKEDIEHKDQIYKKKISWEGQRNASKSNYTPLQPTFSGLSEGKDVDKEKKRRQIYGAQRINEEEVDQPTENAQNCSNFNDKSHNKSPYSQTMSTASSYSNRLKPQQSKNQIKIEDFALGKLLGTGKFGEVYVAQHKKTGFISALKIISKKHIDEKFLTQLTREIKIQGFLNHPNIVKLYGFFSDERNFYLIQELCSSGQLYSLLKKKRKLTEETTRAIIQQICKALDYIHAYQIIHRDLKPQNIIYQNGLVKICDFGWSISSKTMRDTFCGTPLYVSPELLKRRNYNNKIDVWSIGILTYELLFGRVPFQITIQKDFVRIIEEDIKFTKAMTVSQQAKDFILVCLKKDPRDRYTVPELLEHPFLLVQGGTLSDLF